MEKKYKDKIKVFYSSKCDSIDQLPGGGGIEVKASLGVGGKGGGTKVFRPRLLVGADGLKSTVSIFMFIWCTARCCTVGMLHAAIASATALEELGLSDVEPQAVCLKHNKLLWAPSVRWMPG